MENIDMSIYKRLKNHVIEKHPDAVARYASYINSIDYITPRERLIGYLYFIKLLINGNRIKKIRLGEFEDTKREDINQLIARLLRYDVVSFDIFDTLILREVERPIDIFRLVGMRQHIIGFSQIRQDAEQYCLYKYANKYTIVDIYNTLSEMNGINAQQCLEEEMNMEMQLTVANPYIKKIYDAMIAAGKKVIIISDMYLPKEYMESLLKKCGYFGWTKLYISCDYSALKRTGNLYEVVKNDLQDKEKVIHIGDNYYSDVVMARRKGFHSVYYESVMHQGQPYRNSNVTDQSIGVSVANALINIEIHNGIHLMNDHQQYGYIFGGMLITGFCHWLNDVAHDKKIDKFLFLARDADIMYQCYNKYYGERNCEYVYASRRSVLILIFDRYPKFFVERVLKEWAEEADKPIGKMLEELHMTCLIQKLSDVHLKQEDIFSLKTYKNVTQLMYIHKNEIVDELQEVRMAARIYWQSVIGNSASIALVDVGWRGTISIGLKYFLNQICGMNVRIYCIQLSTKRDQWNEQEFDNGEMLSYCCSSDYNKQMHSIMKHDLIRIKIIEMLFSSCSNSLAEYRLDENNKIKMVFESDRQSDDMIQNMHKGVITFIEQYKKVEKKLGLVLSIAGEDAFQSIFNVKTSKRYVYELFREYIYHCTADDGSKLLMGQYFKDNGYM